MSFHIGLCYLEYLLIVDIFLYPYIKLKYILQATISLNDFAKHYLEGNTATKRQRLPCGYKHEDIQLHKKIKKNNVSL